MSDRDWVNGGDLFGGVSHRGMDRLISDQGFLASVIADAAILDGILPPPSLAGRYLDARDKVRGVYLTYREARG